MAADTREKKSLVFVELDVFITGLLGFNEEDAPCATRPERSGFLLILLLVAAGIDGDVVAVGVT